MEAAPLALVAGVTARVAEAVETVGEAEWVGRVVAKERGA